MQHKRPILEKFYGTPLWYRIEHRKSGDAIVVSYRDEKGRVQYEAAPVGGKKAATSVHKAEEGGAALGALPEEVMAEILRGWIGLHTPEGCKRRKSVSDLTLGVLLTADKRELLFKTGSIRSESTVKDEDRVLRMILKHWGATPWREVTPKNCAEWLACQSTRTKRDIKRLMCRYEKLQLNAGIISSVTWEHYKAKESTRRRQPHRALVRGQIEQTVLTDGQCRELVAGIQARIATESVTEIDLALLLVLTAILELEEVAALTWEDFSYLDDFPERLTVEVKKVCQRIRKKFGIVELDDPYKRRRIPLPTIAEECYRALISRKGLSPQTPFIHSRHGKKQRMTPEMLRHALAERVSLIQIEKITDVRVVKARKPEEMLAPTGLRALKIRGLEDEELRAVRGQRPKLVSGRCYYDRNCESALEKIGAVQDRWMDSLCERGRETSCIISGDRLQAIGASLCWVSPGPGQRTVAIVSIDVPPIPPSSIPQAGICFELTAKYGCAGTILFETTE